MRITSLQIDPPADHTRAAAMDAQGYSTKMPTDYKIKTDTSNRARRVYCYQISNAGTLFIMANGERQTLTTAQQSQLEELRDQQEHPTTYAQRWTEAANRAHAMQELAANAVAIAEDAPPELAQELAKLQDDTATANSASFPAIVYIDDWQDLEARARVLRGNARQHAPQTTRGAQHAAILNYCRTNGDRETLLSLLAIHRRTHDEPLADAANAAEELRARAYELEPAGNADPMHAAVTLQDAAKRNRDELRTLATRHA